MITHLIYVCTLAFTKHKIGLGHISFLEMSLLQRFVKRYSQYVNKYNSEAVGVQNMAIFFKYNLLVLFYIWIILEAFKVYDN